MHCIVKVYGAGLPFMRSTFETTNGIGGTKTYQLSCRLAGSSNLLGTSVCGSICMVCIVVEIVVRRRRRWCAVL